MWASTWGWDDVVHQIVNIYESKSGKCDGCGNQKSVTQEGKRATTNSDNIGWNALFYAARGGHQNIVKILVPFYKDEINHKDNAGRTVLDIAGESSGEIFEILNNLFL